MIRSLIACSLVLLGFAVLLAGEANAQPRACDTWYVATDGDDDNPGNTPERPFATIAHALLEEVAAACDTIIVAAGTYAESGLTVNVPLTIRGANESSPPIIDGGNASRIIEIDDDLEGVVFEDLTLIGGTDTAVFVGSGSSLTLSNCRIEGDGSSGRGLYLGSGATASMSGGRISNRSGWAVDGGRAGTRFFANGVDFIGNEDVFIQYYEGIECVNCLFQYNTGRIITIFGYDKLVGEEQHPRAKSGTSALFSGCEFYDNTGDIAIKSEASGMGNVDVIGCIFDGNNYGTLFDCSIYGGIAVLTIADSQIRNTTGRILFLNNFSATLVNTLIADGTGDFYLGYYSSISLQTVRIVNNQGTMMSIDEGEVYIDNSIIANNSGSVLYSFDDEFGPVISVINTNIYNNGGGDWVGILEGLLGQDGNISTNPLFCDPWNGNYVICSPEDLTWFTASPLESGPFGCDEPALLTYHYSPVAGTSPVRGYEVRLLASDPLLITPDDMTIFTVPDGAQTFSDVIENAPGDLTVNYAILGDTGQIETAADLFTLQVHGVDTGTGTVQIASLQFRDPDNNPVYVIEGTPASITYACTAPEAVTAITASPGHDKVEVSWAHDGEYTDHYAIFRGLWYADDDVEISAYPEYNRRVPNVIPARPSDYTEAVDSPEWVLAGTVPAGTLVLTDDEMTTGRGVYYYEVFALDVVENASPPADAGSCATNYWLGDIEPNGLVDINDVNRFGDSFGVCSGHPSFDPECDVGPTDDNSRFGVPVPDGCVDFEDLMILAMNFGRVDPGKSLPSFDATVHLAWVRLDENHYALRLVGGEGMQGLRVRAALPAGSNVSVQAGELLSIQTGPTFLRNVGQALDVSLAVIGAGEGFQGTGALFTVEVAAAINGEDLVIHARGLDNSDLEVSFDQITGVEVPMAFNLSANFPNPFNPATTIRFALPEPQPVKLAIYGVDGRRVALLVDAAHAAGVHEITWHGKDDHGRLVAAGTYVYRINAGPYRKTRKMVLIK